VILDWRLMIEGFDGAAQYSGNLRADLEKQGTPIGSLDMLIAHMPFLSAAFWLPIFNRNRSQVQGFRGSKIKTI